MGALYNYMEPFSAECRAFGRLQESGHEELAVRCFGYVLMDEEHERAMLAQCDLSYWHFNGGGDEIGYDEEYQQRTHFLGKNGRPPPLRCIVKALGNVIGIYEEDTFREGMARGVLRDIVKLQKLGIMQMDIGIRQFVDGKIGDFSTAITMPHFITSPELNPNLTPAMIDAMKKSTFEHCVNDYLDFDSMIHDWNLEFSSEKGHMSIQAYPGGRGITKSARYNLRSRATARKPLYTFVDPRKYGWTARPAADGGSSRAPASKTRPPQLTARPDMWHFDYGEKDQSWADEIGADHITIPHGILWSYNDGCIFPVVSRPGVPLVDRLPGKDTPLDLS